MLGIRLTKKWLKKFIMIKGKYKIKLLLYKFNLMEGLRLSNLILFLEKNLLKCISQ